MQTATARHPAEHRLQQRVRRGAMPASPLLRHEQALEQLLRAGPGE